MKTYLYKTICLITVAMMVLFPVFMGHSAYAEGPIKIFLPAVSKGSGGTPPPPPGVWSSADKALINSLVTNAGFLMPGTESSTSQTRAITETIGTEVYWADETSKSITQNKTELMYLGANDDILWPGALINGSQAHNFVYTPITLPRAPMVLSANFEGAACGSLIRQVTDPTLSNTREGIRLLMEQAKSKPGCTLPARAQYISEQVYNESSLNLALGANVKASVGSLGVGFDWDQKTKKNKIITSYQQIFYEVNIDTPLNQSDFFDPTRTTVEEIAAKMPPGSKPMYVAGVQYGMMALMFIETNFSEDTVSAAVDAAYSSGGITATITSTLTVKDVLDKSNIKIVVYGGSTANLGDILTGPAGFEAVIKANARADVAGNPPVPLAYKFRHFADNNLALISFTTDFAFTTNGFPMYPRIGVVLESFDPIRGYYEDSPFLTVYEMTDMGITVNGKNRSSYADSGVAIEPQNQSTGCWWGSGCSADLELDDNTPYPSIWPPSPRQPIELVYNNNHNPYNWQFAKLSIHGQAKQMDTWPDAWDSGSYDFSFLDGRDILGGSWSNYDSDKGMFYKVIAVDFPVIDEGWLHPWKLDLRCKFRIYFYNRYP